MSSLDKKALEFEKSLEQRNFEISLFWKRSWFFGVLILALISGYIDIRKDNCSFIPFVMISFLIALITLFQCLMNRGSKYWQERWEHITFNRESVLDISITRTAKKYPKGDEKFYLDTCIESKESNYFTYPYRFSVSKIAILVWDIIFLTAIVVWISDSIEYTTFNSKEIDIRLTAKLFLYYCLIFGYCILFIKKGKFLDRIKLSIPKGDTVETLKNEYINNQI